MKSLACLLLGLAFASVAVAAAPDHAAAIRRDASRCAQALLHADFAVLADFTHPRIVAGLGGRDAMIAAMKKGVEQMHAQGLNLLEASTGEPEKPLAVAHWLVAFVPERIVLQVSGGRLIQSAHLLAISENSGHSWTFVDVDSAPIAQLEKIFPELAGLVVFPAPVPPQFVADPAK